MSFPIVFEINADAVWQAIEEGANLRVEVNSPTHYKVTLVRRTGKKPAAPAIAKRAANG